MGSDRSISSACFPFYKGLKFHYSRGCRVNFPTPPPPTLLSNLTPPPPPPPPPPHTHPTHTEKKISFMKNSVSIQKTRGVTNHWTGLLDWTTGLKIYPQNLVSCTVATTKSYCQSSSKAVPIIGATILCSATSIIVATPQYQTNCRGALGR